MAKTAKDIMTTDLITTTSSATVAQVARVLVRNKISGMPVVEEGTAIGVISEADILTADGNTTIDWVMSSDVVSVRPDTPMAEIADILKAQHIKRVLVIEESCTLVGIVSRADVIAGMAFE